MTSREIAKFLREDCEKIDNIIPGQLHIGKAKYAACEYKDYKHPGDERRLYVSMPVPKRIDRLILVIDGQEWYAVCYNKEKGTVIFMEWPDNLFEIEKKDRKKASFSADW